MTYVYNKYYVNKVFTVMVNNSTNTNKMNNYVSSQLIDI